jgi:hypothetical protein
VLVFTVFCAIDQERGDEVFHMPVSGRTRGVTLVVCGGGV